MRIRSDDVLSTSPRSPKTSGFFFGGSQSGQHPASPASSASMADIAANAGDAGDAGDVVHAGEGMKGNNVDGQRGRKLMENVGKVDAQFMEKWME